MKRTSPGFEARAARHISRMKYRPLSSCWSKMFCPSIATWAASCPVLVMA